MKIGTLGVIVILILFSLSINAQSFTKYENDLKILFDELNFQQKDAKIDSINNIIKNKVKSFIEISKSQEFNFTTLNKLKVLKSDDKRVLIYNWNTVYSDGSYKYHGFIQYYHKRSHKFKVFELNSETKNNERNIHSILNHKNRIPAFYYSITYKKYKRKAHYILLAWAGVDDFRNRKYIEVLHFDKAGNPIFGKKILSNGKSMQTRMIFEYSEQVSMLLHYDANYKMIVWDHLSPKNKTLTGQYQFYGPDFTYDGLFFKKGKWDFYSNIKVKNK